MSQDCKLIVFMAYNISIILKEAGSNEESAIAV